MFQKNKKEAYKIMILFKDANLDFCYVLQGFNAFLNGA